MTTTNAIDAPQSGTKEANLVSALTGKGRTIAQLTERLGWQPHTVRAAFTRLRKRGYIVERVPPTTKSPAKFRLRSGKAAEPEQ
jgi:predicted ArsR family transcriptional regulator